jgi:hypothetical protein
MAMKMQYWKPIKIHSFPTPENVSKSMVKHNIPLLVITEITAVICKMDNQVPISSAPIGTGRLKTKRS